LTTAGDSSFAIFFTGFSPERISQKGAEFAAKATAENIVINNTAKNTVKNLFFVTIIITPPKRLLNMSLILWRNFSTNL
jgi:hypothetical protein